MRAKKEVDYLNDKRYGFKLGNPNYVQKTKEEIEDSYVRNKANQRQTLGNQYYTVFRVGDKFKMDGSSSTLNLDELGKFSFHSNRTAKTPKDKLPINVDPKRTAANRIIIGSENVIDDVRAYLEGVKIYKNSVIAREIVLSAGNGFWNRFTNENRELWIETNYNFLKKYFGDNCVYAILHMDK